MKYFLTLLLLIPSFSLAEIIPLTCNQFYKNPDYLIKLKSSYKDSNHHPNREYKIHKVVFLFDNQNMTLKSMGFMSKLRSQDEYKYVFDNFQDDGKEYYTHLNKYTHQITQSEYFEDKLQQTISYDCKIAERIL